MSKKMPLTSSFKYAFQGLKTAIKKEPNFRVHIVLALIAISSAFLLKFPYLEWIILIFTISFVIIMELVNTTLEAIVDVVKPEVHPKARIAKDVSAGAVLVSAISAFVIGVILFLPKLLALV